MTDYEVDVAGSRATPPSGWRAEWIDRDAGIVRLTDGGRSVVAAVDGEGSERYVTLSGRRVAASVLSWRERMLAEASAGAAGVGGPVEVKATLPGLVVAVAVAAGDEVAEGDPLLTIEAMKMQNEVRAPRAGRIAAVAVEPGRAVATGALLLRLE
jgi:biotin carboxyl carrier protein